MDKPSKNSTSTNKNSPPQNSSPHSPSEENTPTETNPREERSETIMKTPEEVLAELTAGDDEIIENSDHSGSNRDNETVPSVRGGTVPRTVTTTLTVDGRSHSSTVAGDSSSPALKKRKNTQVKDPPSGTPTCPECGRKFSTWKAAFGHMRKHPERPHRGFFPPPTFSTNNVVPRPQPQPQPQGEGVASIVRELVIDLNRSIGVTAGSSTGGGSGSGTRRNQVAVAQQPENEERRRIIFDLNELPSKDNIDDDNDDENQ